MKRIHGFSLLEVMIVLAVLAAVMTIAVPRFRKANNNIKSVCREFLVLSKELKHYAQLKNSTYRLVIQMKDKEQLYWVEASNKKELVQSEKKQKQQEESMFTEKKQSPFRKTDKPLKKEKQLPDGIFFKSVETIGRSEPITKDLAYIHYSPDGLVEQSIIQISDGKKLNWSLIINPLTGKVDIIEKEMRLKDLEHVE